MENCFKKEKKKAIKDLELFGEVRRKGKGTQTGEYCTFCKK